MSRNIGFIVQRVRNATTSTRGHGRRMGALSLILRLDAALEFHARQQSLSQLQTDNLHNDAGT
jgi:hypothetical protein